MGRLHLRRDRLADGQPVLIWSAPTSDIPRSTLLLLRHEIDLVHDLAHPSLAPPLRLEIEPAFVRLLGACPPGVCLAERLAAGPLAFEAALALADGVLAALEAVHERGALHLGMTPTAVFVDGQPPAERVTLSELGLARLRRIDLADPAERARLAVYTAPEQAGLINREVDERADLYALGILLFEALAGYPPFHADRTSDILRQHLAASVPELRTQAVAVPPGFDAFVQHLVCKDPRDRYQSARSARADLQELTGALTRGEWEAPLIVGRHEQHRSLVEPTFIGRAHELEELARCTSAAADGQGGLVLVEAESGGGKTRLLDELRARELGDGVLVLRGQGLDQAAVQPLQTLAAVAEDLLSAVQAEPELAEQLRSRLGERQQAVAAALPRLASVFETASETVLPEGFGTMRSMDALAALLDSLGSPQRPVLVLLDDCHWADEATLNVLDYWQRGSPEARHTLVVVALRTEDTGPDHPLRRLQPLARLSLPRFGPPDVERMVESMAGPLPREAVDLVTDLADGSPFMVSAVMRGLVEARALVPNTGGGWRVEAAQLADARASHRAAVFLAHRLELLPAQSLGLLTVGAVLGKDFDLALAAAVSGLPQDEVMHAIDAARARHMVWVQAHAEVCSFVHDKLRESLLDRLAPSERRALHRRAAEHLEAAQPDRAFDLAYHFDAADEPERALPYALQAADAARAVHGLDAAEVQYRIALRGAPADDSPLRLHLAEGLADVLILRGRYEEAEAQIVAARSLATDPVARAELDRKLSDLEFKRGNVKHGIAACESALAHLGRPVPASSFSLTLQFIRELCLQVLHTLVPRWLVGRHGPAPSSELFAVRLYSTLALNYYFDRGLVPTLWAVLRGLNLAERYAPSEELALAYADHSVAMSMSGLFGRAIAYGRKSLAIRQASGYLWGQGQSLNRLGIALYGASRYAEALETSREAVRILERTGDYWEGNSIARLQVAYALWRMGELRAAAETGRQVHEAALRIGDHQGAAYGLWAWSVASEGHVPGTLIQAELSRPNEASLVRVYLLMAEGRRLLADGRPLGARQALEEARRLIRDDRMLGGDYLVPVRLMLATALRERAEQLSTYAPDERARLLQAAEREARAGLRQARTFKNNLPHALRECGLVAAARGRIGPARELLERSLRTAEQQSARAEAAWTRLARGQVGVARGWPHAEDDVASARSSLRRLGGEPEAEAPTLGLVDRFDTLLEVGRRIASALTREAVLSAVHESALLLLRAEECYILDCQADSGDLVALVPASSQPHPAERLARRALAIGRPTTLAESQPVVEAPIQSAIAAPIFVRGVAVACLLASHSQVADLYGEEEVRLAEFVASLAGAALENAEGVAAIEDLSRDLEAKNVELSRLDKLKDEFLANTSHELRTPLSAMIGIAESLIEGAGGSVSEPQRRNLELVVTSGRRLANLVNDILDFSRLKQRDLPLHVAPVDVGSVVSVVLALAETSARARGLRLINAVSSSTPPVLADADRLQQVLLNLVGNAVKFTDAGQITVSAEARDSHLAISVMDTGIGIEASALDRIFESFVQADGSDVRGRGGTGLGLAISKQLVELHGGTIEVTSQPGQGTCFTFTLPLSAEPVTARLPERSIAQARQDTPTIEVEDGAVLAEGTDVTILAVDDEPVNLQVLASQLSARGYRVVSAHSAAEALQHIDTGFRPDLLLLDVMMPEMSGYELCQRLRQRFTASELPIILLTARSRVEDLVQGFVVGANDYLTKPFYREELLARIQAHLNLTRLNIASDRFVPREFLNLLGQPSVADVRLGDHVQMETSVIFSDIRSYTTLSERMTPVENLKFLNDYLRHVSPVIRRHNGIIDQYYGDGIKAIFAHSVEHAVGAAMGLRTAVAAFNAERRERGEVDIQIGVGVHTGPLLLGAIGDANRMAVTMLSDIVNTTQRLEALTKMYGVGIVASEQVVRGISDPTRFWFRYLGSVQVKGKTEPVSVYEVFDGDLDDEAAALKRATRADFEEGLRLYYARQFAQAGDYFHRVLARTDDRAAQLYARRAHENLVHGTPPDWLGIEVLTES